MGVAAVSQQVFLGQPKSNCPKNIQVAVSFADNLDQTPQWLNSFKLNKMMCNLWRSASVCSPLFPQFVSSAHHLVSVSSCLCHFDLKTRRSQQPRSLFNPLHLRNIDGWLSEKQLGKLSVKHPHFIPVKASWRCIRRKISSSFFPPPLFLFLIKWSVANMACNRSRTQLAHPLSAGASGTSRRSVFFGVSQHKEAPWSESQ